MAILGLAVVETRAQRWISGGCDIRDAALANALNESK
jgi:hypothetical protein